MYSIIGSKMNYYFNNYLILMILFGCNVHKEHSTEKEPILYLFVDELPKFGESEDDLYRYLYQNVKWPKPFDGTDVILLSLIINEKGSIEDIQIEKASYKPCAEAVIRVLLAMPPWKPGIKNNRPAKVKIFLPLNFVLK